jgi:hypothetical protein
VIPARFRRSAGAVEAAESEGPFVSFTDLFIGILFLFLILVAALMLMHQEAIQMEQIETEKMQTEAKMLTEQIRQLQAKLDAVPKPKPEQPAFRLGIVFNIYQRPAGTGAEWTYSRTVRIFRSPSGECINTVYMRSNLSVGWLPPVADDDIPTAAQKDDLGSFRPCGMSASSDQWNRSTETGNLKRVSKDLYSGTVVLHKTEGDSRLEMQYRILGIYDDYFRSREFH